MLRLAFPLLVAAGIAAAAPADDAPPDKAARYLAALERRPVAGTSFDRLIDAWLEGSDLESLERFLRRRAEAAPQSAAPVLLGLLLSRQGDDAAALAAFRTATDARPEHTAAWAARAAAETRLRDFDAAIASLTKARAADKARPDASLRIEESLGRLLARAGRRDEALALWQELITARPDDTSLLEDLMDLQAAEGMTEAALATAARLAGTLTDPYQRLLVRLRTGDIHARAGNRDAALAAWLACLDDTGPGSWLEKEVLAQIERLFRSADDLPGLRRTLESRLAARPVRPAVHRACAAAMAATGDRPAGLAVLRALIDLTPGDRSVREECAAMLRDDGRAAEALALTESLLAQHPDDEELRLRLAVMRHEAGDSAGSRRLLDEFHERAGRSEAAALRRAAILEQFGDHAAAAASLDAAAAAAAPESPVASVRASLLARAGQPDKALEAWHAAAATAGSVGLLQITRSVATASGPAAAFDLLLAQASRFPADPLVLTRLCDLAAAAGRSRDALPFVRPLLAAARSDLSGAIEAVLRAVRAANAADDFRRQLAETDASPAERCFLARLHEAAGDGPTAERLLADLPAEIAGPQRVQLLVSRSDWPAAAAVQEALVALPAFRKPDAARLLTDLQRRTAAPDKAEAAARLWMQLAPSSPAPVLALASILTDAGREADALRLLRSAAGRFDDSEEIRIRLAEAAVAGGRPAEALGLYRALHDAARDLDARMRWLQPWAAAAMQANRLPDLVEEFEERRRAARDRPEPLLALAELHRLAGDFTSRRAALADAARIGGQLPDTALEIAALHEREGDAAAAIAVLRPALAKDGSGRVRERLARLLLAGPAPEEGLRLMQEAIADAADPAAALEAMAAGLFRAGRHAEALQVLQSRPDAVERDYRLRFLTGLVLLAQGQEGAAGDAFCDLVAWTTELPDARRRRVLTQSFAPPTPEDEANAQLLDIFPGRAADVFAVVSIRAALRDASSGSVNVSWPLPASLEQLRRAALGAAAAAMVREKNESRRSTWLRRLADAGCGFMELLPLLPDADPFGGADPDPHNPTPWRDVAARRSDSKELLAVAAAADALSWMREADPDLSASAWQAFAASDPVFALVITLPAIGRSASPPPWETDALAALERVDKPHPLLVIAILKSLQRNPDTLPADRRAALAPLHARLLAWHPDIDFRSPLFRELRAMIVGTLTADMVRRDDAAALARLLAHELDHPSGPLTYASPGSPLEGLDFPPAQLPDVPQLLIDLCTAPEQFLGETNRPLTAEFLATAAAHTDRPLLRALMLAALPDPDAQRPAIQALAAPEAKDPAGLLLAGAWFVREEELDRAADCFLRALNSPLPRELRVAADGSLAGMGDEAAPGDPLHRTARDAALRLRREARSTSDRRDLAIHLAGLGLAAEAAALAPPGTPLPTPPGSDAAIGKGDPDAIASLMRAGDRPGATAALARDLLGVAARAVPAEVWAEEFTEFTAWRAQADAWELTAAAADFLTTDTASPPLARGIALVWLERPDAARPALESALAGPPDIAAAARARLVHIETDAGNPDKAAAHLLALAPDKRFMAWRQLLDDGDFMVRSDVRRRTAAADMLATVVAAWTDSARGDDQWLAQAAFQVLGNDRDDETRKLAVRLLPPLCRMPGSGLRALRLLASWPELPVEVLFSAACDAAKSAAEGSARSPGGRNPPLWHAPLPRRTGSSWLMHGREWSDAAWIAVSLAAGSGRLSEFTARVVDPLAAGPAVRQAAAARAVAAAFAASPDEFPAACRRLLDEDPRTPPWQVVGAIAAARRLDPGLTDRFEQLLKTPLTAESGPRRAAAAAALTTIAAATAGPEGAARWLEGLFDRMAGPEDSRPARFASLQWQDGAAVVNPSEPASVLPLMLEESSTHPAAMLAALAIARDRVAPLLTESAREAFLSSWPAAPQPLRWALSAPRPEDAVAALRELGLLAEFANLRPLGGGSSLWGSLRSLGRSARGPATPAARLAELVAGEPDTNGRRLVHALLRDDGAAALHNELGCITGPRRAEWVRAVVAMDWPPHEPDLTEAGRAFAAEVRAAAADVASRLASEALVTLERLAVSPDLTDDGSACAEVMGRALAGALARGSEAVAALLPLCFRAAAHHPDAPILGEAFDAALQARDHPALLLTTAARAASAPGAHQPLTLIPDTLRPLLEKAAGPVPDRWTGPPPPSLTTLLPSSGERLALLHLLVQQPVAPEAVEAFTAWVTGGRPWREVLADREVSAACRLFAAIAANRSDLRHPDILPAALGIVNEAGTSGTSLSAESVSALVRQLAAQPALPAPDVIKPLLPRLAAAVMERGPETEDLVPLLDLTLHCGETGRARALLREHAEEAPAFFAAVVARHRRADLLPMAVAAQAMDDESPPGDVRLPPATLTDEVLTQWLPTVLPDASRRWRLVLAWAADGLDRAMPEAVPVLVRLAGEWNAAGLASPVERTAALARIAAWPPALGRLPEDALAEPRLADLRRAAAGDHEAVRRLITAPDFDQLANARAAVLVHAFPTLPPDMVKPVLDWFAPPGRSSHPMAGLIVQSVAGVSGQEDKPPGEWPDGDAPFGLWAIPLDEAAIARLLGHFRRIPEADFTAWVAAQRRAVPPP